jgi:hypothetical protein
MRNILRIVPGRSTTFERRWSQRLERLGLRVVLRPSRVNASGSYSGLSGQLAADQQAESKQADSEQKQG